MIAIRPIRPSDINAVVSLYNRRLWQRHSGFDEWNPDPAHPGMMLPWEKLTLYQRWLNAGVWCDPVLYKNHLNWLTKSGGFALAAEETAGVMKRLTGMIEVWCGEEPAPLGKTGSVVLLEVDTQFGEDPASKLYAQAKKEIRNRSYSTLAICPFSSRAVNANLDDRRWELVALTRRYRVRRDKLGAPVAYRAEELSRPDLPGDFYCLDQSAPPAYQWNSLWEEFDGAPEVRGSLRRQPAQRVTLDHGGSSVTAALWIWATSDAEDYWRLALWVPAGRHEDRELTHKLAVIAGAIWADVPGFELVADEENGPYLLNRGFTLDESRPGEPRYYTAV